MQAYGGQREGSLRYHYEGYDYRRDNRQLVQFVNYRCCKRKCPGRATHRKTSPDKVRISRIHNHERDESGLKSSTLRKSLIDRAQAEPHLDLKKIYEEECKKFKEGADNLRSPNALKKKMRLVQAAAAQQVPDTLLELSCLLSEDFEIIEEYGHLTLEADHVGFFQRKVETSQGVGLIFGTQLMAETCLKTSDTVVCDIFQVSLSRPKCQGLLTLSARHGSHSFSSVVIFLETLSQQLLKGVLSHVKELGLNFCPKFWVCNNHSVLRNALESVWPAAKFEENYFHYVQKVQSLASRNKLHRLPVMNQSDTKSLVLSLLAVPFARSEDLRKLFDDLEMGLSLRLSSTENIIKFLKEFEGCFLKTSEEFCVFGQQNKTDCFLKNIHTKYLNMKPNIWIILKQVMSICKDAHIAFGKFRIGVDIPEPSNFLLDDSAITQARLLYLAGEISPMQFILWCRKSVKDTQHIVLEERRLRRLRKAEAKKTEFHEEQTSSDSASESDNESLPATDDSMWNLEGEDDVDFLAISASERIEEFQDVPVVSAPSVISSLTRMPGSCIVCISHPASFIARPCKHSLVCEDCFIKFTETRCPRCGDIISELIDFIAT